MLTNWAWNQHLAFNGAARGVVFINYFPSVDLRRKEVFTLAIKPKKILLFYKLPCIKNRKPNEVNTDWDPWEKRTISACRHFEKVWKPSVRVYRTAEPRWHVWPLINTVVFQNVVLLIIVHRYGNGCDTQQTSLLGKRFWPWPCKKPSGTHRP